jgi:diamine N-acetyltransferase
MQSDVIELRPCDMRDCEALALVGGATFLESFAGILEGDAIVAHCAKHHSVESYAKYLGAPDCKAWLAEAGQGGAPVGYVMLTKPDLPLPDLGSQDIELKRIYLFSRFHGKGAGKMLLDQAITGARDLGMRRLLLGVYAKNFRALDFYRRNGFVEVGTRTFQVGSMLCDDLLFGRSL